MRRPRPSLIAGLVLVSLLSGVIALQVVRERLEPRRVPAGVGGNLMYVRSPAVMARLALSYRSLVADVYWIRALQHYGRTRRALPGQDQSYDLLYPLLDLTTSLDPRFNLAYRFGALFLTEPPPGGPGRPDLAIALLKKGLTANPQRWEYAQDIGFVHYRQRDYVTAADWFRHGAAIPGAPDWLQRMEAVTRTRGGDRETARRMWFELLRGAGEEEQWLRKEASRRLRQLEALDRIDALSRIIQAYEQRTGDPPASWQVLVRAGLLQSVPLDPDGFPFALNPYWGIVNVDRRSPLFPLPIGEEGGL